MLMKKNSEIRKNEMNNKLLLSKININRSKTSGELFKSLSTKIHIYKLS